MEEQLTRRQKERIREKVGAGLYGSPSEVVDRALDLLDDFEHEVGELRENIRAGIEQADRGELTPASEVFDELRKRNEAARRAE